MTMRAVVNTERRADPSDPADLPGVKWFLDGFTSPREASATKVEPGQGLWSEQ